MISGECKRALVAEHEHSFKVSVLVTVLSLTHTQSRSASQKLALYYFNSWSMGFKYIMDTLNSEKPVCWRMKKVFKHSEFTVEHIFSKTFLIFSLLTLKQSITPCICLGQSQTCDIRIVRTVVYEGEMRTWGHFFFFFFCPSLLHLREKVRVELGHVMFMCINHQKRTYACI